MALVGPLLITDRSGLPPFGLGLKIDRSLKLYVTFKSEFPAVLLPADNRVKKSISPELESVLVTVKVYDQVDDPAGEFKFVETMMTFAEVEKLNNPSRAGPPLPEVWEKLTVTV